MKNGYSRNLYVLGAGFTKAAIPNAPLNNELAKAIIEINPGILEKYCNKYDSDDIELILTKMDIEQGSFQGSGLRHDRKQIEGQIANYFTRYRFMAERSRKWVKRFARDVLEIDDSIISLNYDCYLEGALDYFRVWTPNGGYPKPIIHPLAEDIRPNPENIKIYKIHGSENFRDPLFFDDPHTTIQSIINGEIYPISGANKHFGAGGIDSKPYIIAPSFVKIPHVYIEYLMLAVLDIANIVDNLVIIGCGMRPEDSFLWLILTRFLYGTSKDVMKKLIILGPSSEEILCKIKDHCAPRIDQIAKIIPISLKLEDAIDDLLKELKCKSYPLPGQLCG